jgi:hypothetical protein
MKVFGLKYVEPMASQSVVPVSEWSWTPTHNEAHRIYGSGASTSSRESTYAAEADNRADHDRPNEGMAA